MASPAAVCEVEAGYAVTRRRNDATCLSGIRLVISRGNRLFEMMHLLRKHSDQVMPDYRMLNRFDPAKF